MHTDASASRTVTSAVTLDEVGAAMTATYSDVMVRAPVARELRLRLTTLKLPDVAVSDLELTRSEVRTASFPWFAVCLPVRGQVKVSTPRDTTAVSGRRGTVVAPGDEATVDYLSSHCHMRTVLIERAAMECELHSMLGHPTGAPLSFEPAVEHGDGNPLNRTLALLAPEFGPTGLATYPALAVRLSRLVIAGVLTSYRHNYSDELEAPAYRQHPRAIRLAVEFIESHPEVITTVADIARTVGLSVRALNAGFQRSVGTTPTRYLRRVRLARVHEELRRGDPSTITATAAARRWGFAHYGRFAADYRAVYGTAPASTLRSTGGTHGSNLWSLKRSSRRA